MSNLVSWPKNLSRSHSSSEMSIREYEELFHQKRLRMQESTVKFCFERLCWTYSGRICTKGKLGISFPKQNSLSDTATLGTKQATEKRYFILIIMGRDHQPTTTQNMRTARYSSKCISSAEQQSFLKFSRCDLESARNTQDHEDYFSPPEFHTTLQILECNSYL